MSLPDDRNQQNQSSSHATQVSVYDDPHSKADDYYGGPPAGLRGEPKHRTFSAIVESSTNSLLGEEIPHKRRFSQDAPGQQARQFLIPVDETMKQLLANEDSDRNYQITVEDKGPKVDFTVLF